MLILHLNGWLEFAIIVCAFGAAIGLFYPMKRFWEKREERRKS
jgi:hypothetical protein